MFDGLKLTNKGIELLAAILAGHTVQFTKIKMGDGNEPSNFMTLTNLVNVRQTLNIARKEIVNNTILRIGANLSGSDVGSGFYWKEIGIFAKDLDGDNTEYLFSYDNAGAQASYIPAGGIVTEQLIDLEITVGNTDNITVVIDESLVFPTIEEMNNAITTAITSVTTNLGGQINTLSTNLSSHTRNRNNPHSVTASQVGLGSVQNYDIASQAEAQAGSANNKYMTPVRVKNAIDQFVTRANLQIDNVQNYGLATESEAKAGISNVKYMTPLRVANYVNDKVNATFVGLGNVNNYGVATQAEAQAGSSNAKYMTPLRAKELLVALGVQSAGNMKIVVSSSQPSVISGTTQIWINTSS